MPPMHTRVATGVAAILFVSAAANLSLALAQQAPTTSPDVISTTCGAGTLEACGTAPITACDWDVGLTYNPMTGLSLRVTRVNCRSTGSVPIYKNTVKSQSQLSGSCDLLAPFLGMPVGSGCSD